MDPFDYPMPGRRDLMSLSVIDHNKDNFKVTTNKMTTNRNISQNLTTQDIQGAESRKFIPERQRPE